MSSPPARPRALALLLLVRGAAVACGLALALGLAELACFWLDPYGAPSQGANSRQFQEQAVQVDLSHPRLYWHRPDLDLEFRTFQLRTDGRGFRGEERGLEKPPGVRRLLFLGDSVVHGWGVSDGDTFVQQVEALLAAQESERPWQTINGAMPGYDSSQELATFAEVGRHYAPDLVVLVYVDNDIVPTRLAFEAGAQAQTGARGVSAEARRILRLNQSLAELGHYLPNLAAVLSQLVVKSNPVVQTGAASHALEMGLDLEQGFELSCAALLGMRDLAAELGAPFAVLDYYQGPGLPERLRDFCTREGIPYGSIAFSAQEKASGVVNSAADPHANAAGHRILARNIVDRLTEFGFLP
jgi:lysophospholipase L1-like esterase